ncbi:MAG: type II and III secretion system protein [Magnetococcales bacterium]|nr:type II and III secretion system protein [Magnetococcales bacterium]
MRPPPPQPRHRALTGKHRPNWAVLLPVLLAFGCARPSLPVPPPVESQTLGQSKEAADTIPDTVKVTPFLPKEGGQSRAQDLYTVVVTDVPVREVLFALARDANLNIDILANINGQISLNAIEQTLPRILDRIARQADLWYRIEEGTLVVGPEVPVRRNYRVDYVSANRNVETKFSISTTVASDTQTSSGTNQSGVNSSSVNLNTASGNEFWKNLIGNIREIVGIRNEPGKPESDENASKVIWNEATGIISVMATSLQHREIGEFIDRVVNSARRQVLIEATVLEVQLTDQFQGGIDWNLIRSDGLRETENQLALAATRLNTSPRLALNLNRAEIPFLSGLLGSRDISATVRLLSKFGNTRVLSSPRITVMNNQTALLRVTTNEVYFQIKVTPPRYADDKLVTAATTETLIRTVPIGFIMQVTPQISENEAITLNIRPTIQRVSKWVDNPDPNLRANLGNNLTYTPPQVPVVQVQEMDSVLRVGNGQVAVMGGLMENTRSDATDGVPILSRLPILSNFFSFREERSNKTELVIFLRPMVMTEPVDSLSGHDQELLNGGNEKPAADNTLAGAWSTLMGTP